MEINDKILLLSRENGAGWKLRELRLSPLDPDPPVPIAYKINADK
jgi:hypothetical protein